MTAEEVLVFTRLAADAVQPTKMDRPEDVEPSLRTGRDLRRLHQQHRPRQGRQGRARPRPTRAPPTSTATSSRSADRRRPHRRRLRLEPVPVCGDPATPAPTSAASTGPVSPISCPDNVAFDSVGNLWISTDGNERVGTTTGCSVPVAGPGARARAAVPGRAGRRRDLRAGHPRPEGSVFVAVQHPGEDGTWDAPQSRFPDFVPAGPGAPGRLRRPPADRRPGHPPLYCPGPLRPRKVGQSGAGRRSGTMVVWQSALG